jgi:hypothetical protein
MTTLEPTQEVFVPGWHLGPTGRYAQHHFDGEGWAVPPCHPCRP